MSQINTELLAYQFLLLQEYFRDYWWWAKVFNIWEFPHRIILKRLLVLSCTNEYELKTILSEVISNLSRPFLQNCLKLGSSQTWLFDFSCRSAFLRFCALFCVLAFVLFCSHLHSFCVRLHLERPHLGTSDRLLFEKKTPNHFLSANFVLRELRL